MVVYSYYGEFGYFNTIVLLELSKYFLKNPKEQLTIRTYDDYATILNMIFGKHYTYETVPLTNKRVFHNIDGCDESSTETIPLVNLLNCGTRLGQYVFETKPLKKIKYTSELLEKKYENYPEIVCIFPRNRQLFKEGLDFASRNMDMEMYELCKKIVADIYINKPYKIINIGKQEEMLNIPNVDTVNDIEEIAYLMNRSSLLITTDSGMVDFAKNCGIKNVAIITKSVIAEYQQRYNPFNSKQYFINLSIPNAIPRFRLDYSYSNTGFADMVNSKTRPFVSCICPTYNRNMFLPNLLEIFNNQKYPADLRELIILDDSEVSNIEIINKYNADNNIRYYHLPVKYPIGKKRNILNQLIRGEYVICFDDDDYYPPERVSHAITKMTGTKIGLCGSTNINIYYSDLKQIYTFGPYAQYHGTNGTMGYHRNYMTSHCYNDDAPKAEEALFTNNFSEPMVQLDTMKTILCIAHGSNTFDKKIIINSGKQTKLKLDDFVSEKKLLSLYKSL